jgi:hypothetical protein
LLVRNLVNSEIYLIYPLEIHKENPSRIRIFFFCFTFASPHNISVRNFSVLSNINRLIRCWWWVNGWYQVIFGSIAVYVTSMITSNDCLYSTIQPHTHSTHSIIIPIHFCFRQLLLLVTLLNYGNVCNIFSSWSSYNKTIILGDNTKM